VLVGETASVPLVALVPVQPPVAVHDVALVEDHVSLELPPAVMPVGLADRLTVGVGVAAATVTVVLTTEDVPAAPLQDSEYDVVVVGATETLPVVALAPVQPPVAVQAVALVDDQVRVTLPPLVMLVELADSDAVGAALVPPEVSV